VQTETVQFEPIDHVHPAPDNPRNDLGDVSDLAASIAAVGIIEPLIVTDISDPDHPGEYQLVAGARRLAAAQQAELETVPVIVRDLDDEGRRATMLVENLMRKDLTPLEEAAGYAQLRSLHVDQKTIAEKVGVARSQVSRRIMLLDLPDPVRNALELDELNLRSAETFARLVRMDKTKAAEIAAMPSSAWTYKAERAIQEFQANEWVEARTLELQGMGVRVVGPDVPARFLDVIARAQDDPEGFTDEHASLECHAVQLMSFGRHEYVVCTDPATHGAETVNEADEPEEPTGPSAWDRRREESKARQPFYKALIARQPHDDTRSLIVGVVAFGLTDIEALPSAESLGLESDVDDDEWEVIFTFAESGPRARFAVALGCALDAIDGVLMSGRELRAGEQALVAEHDALLEKVGYTKPEVAA
jgi:ParB/RepB/Spo0J family partition protein